MVTSQILKSVKFTKTQKSRYIENETFFLQIKKFINYSSKSTLWQKSFVADITFKANPELKGCFIFRPTMPHLGPTRIFSEKSLISF